MHDIPIGVTAASVQFGSTFYIEKIGRSPLMQNIVDGKKVAAFEYCLILS